MSDQLTLCSLFDGSGGFCLAAKLVGIKPISSSEIEPFAIAVEKKNFPDVKHYGDVSALNGAKMEPVDIITFGSPCQDMSVAGRRDGLDGSRSCLFYEAIRIIKEMRGATDGIYPRFAVWENVPGAFSSNGGEDFRSVLEAFCSVKDECISVPGSERWTNAGEILADGFSIAWRTLDAQYWGVPQRRKRIYLVADFAGRSAGKILFESEGLSGYSAEGFRAWQRASQHPADSFGEASTDSEVASCDMADCQLTFDDRKTICLNDQGADRMDVDEDVSCTLRAQTHGHLPCVVDEPLKAAGFCTEHSAASRSIGYEEEVSPTLRTETVPAALALENHGTDSRVRIEEGGTVQTLTSLMGTGGNNVPLLMEEQKAYGIGGFNSEGMMSDNPKAGIYEADTSRTLDTAGGNPGCQQGGIAVVGSYAIQGNMIGRDDKNGPQGCGINEDVSFTLNATDRHAVYAMSTGFFPDVNEEVAPTLKARDYKDPTAIAYGIGNGQANQSIDEIAGALNCMHDQQAVVYGLGREVYNTSDKANFSPSIEEEIQPTMVARGPGAVEMEYTVRRLTPTECARLQGFPDWWCRDLGNENPTEDDLRFWADVWETHRRLVSHAGKPKTEKQLRKWLADPYTDAAEYKLWGNGIALPCAYFVLAGIVYYAQFPPD